MNRYSASSGKAGAFIKKRPHDKKRGQDQAILVLDILRLCTVGHLYYKEFSSVIIKCDIQFFSPNKKTKLKSRDRLSVDNGEQSKSLQR